MGGRLKESEVIKQSLIIPEKRSSGHREQQAEAIRKKYKMAPSSKQRTIKHDKSMSALSNFSATEEASPIAIDADLIRFRQKLKGRQRRQGSNLEFSI